MRPDFWFGVAITLFGLMIMTYGAWPRSQPRQFKTLAIWSADNGLGALSWYDGALTKKDIENMGGYLNLRLSQTLTIEGNSVDPEWAKSVSR